MLDLEIFKETQSHWCLKCGEEVLQQDEPTLANCVFCNKSFSALSHCIMKHYVCDECAKLDVYGIIKKICFKTEKKDPISLAVEIMSSSAVKMHGPEHHFIVPAVLLTAIDNLHGKEGNLFLKLAIAEKRAKETAPECEWGKGMCGAAVGAGIFLNILEEIDPSLEDEWSINKQLVAESIRSIVDSPGPRCCKRDTYITLEHTVEFLRDKYSIELPTSEAKCTFSMRNHSCGREDCNYYNIGWSLV